MFNGLDLLPRKIYTCGNKVVNKIISVLKCYKVRVLIGRFKILRYLKEFLLRSKL